MFYFENKKGILGCDKVFSFFCPFEDPFLAHKMGVVYCGGSFHVGLAPEAT